MIVENSHHRRHAQIVSIYRDLNLGENYRPISSNIFGDKRVYSWDKHRSYASVVTYGHNATVGDTVKELSEKAKKAGFTQQKIEYEGSSSPVYEFKNDKGNWLRIRAIPKADRDDAIYGTKTYQGRQYRYLLQAVVQRRQMALSAAAMECLRKLAQPAQAQYAPCRPGSRCLQAFA